MASKHAIQRFRGWYTTLLCLYPKPYRERFGEPMAQTFTDILHEHAQHKKGLFGPVLWMFIETFAEIMRENMTRMTMKNNKNIIRIALVTILLLLIPFIGMLVSDEMNWGLFDFIFMGTLIFGIGLAYELVARRLNIITYRAAVGIALVTAFFLIWINTAVGFIGDEELANAVLVAIPLGIGGIGALLVRFEPRGMAYVLSAMAIAQLLVPLLALFWIPVANFAPSVALVMVLNAFFVALWLGSAFLFQRASTAIPT